MNNSGTTAGLRPMDLVNQPAPYGERYKIVLRLFTMLQKLKSEHMDELKLLARQLEALVAKTTRTGQSYRFSMSILMRDLQKEKGDLSDIKIGGKLLYGNIDDKFITSRVEKINYKITKGEAMEKLKKLIIDVEILGKNGYIKDTISSKPVEIINFTSCIRCNTKFEKKRIMDDVICRYHPLKILYSKKDRSDLYPCCGESSTSVSTIRLGCKQHKNHVFRSENYVELRSITEFTNTTQVNGEENVLALDCEMAFTSLGYEMIRLTIVDFFTLQTLFDEIVQPLGEVIDLNTQFSGVHHIDKNKSLTYHDTIARVVCSQLINRNSIIIGHGLENDLNVLRIIHHNVIDTAILYSKGKFKTSLKNLAFDILNRKIQGGEHDSSEDAIATMDVVKNKSGIPINKKEW